jgi:SAM-dependent methyltransferase
MTVSGNARQGNVGANIARQRRLWNRRAASWDHNAASNPGLVKVLETLLDEASPTASMHVVDLGCGSGQLSLRIAPLVHEVLAVDVSKTMIELLAQNALRASIDNVVGRAVPIEHLEIPEGSVDLVVSNYALHHLRDEDKALAVKRATRWLRAGGRLVIGDMMIGRGGDVRDRQIITSKLIVMLKKGPGGWWRIAKNAGRYLFRFQERPISMKAWTALFEEAGLIDVLAIPVVSEAAVVRGTKPQP